MKKQLKILYIQVRHGDVRDHEFTCVQRSMGLDTSHFIVRNVFENTPTIQDLNHVSGVVVGGSGDYCVSQGHIQKEVASMSAVLYAACERGMPLLAICFGAHVLTKSLGGKVEMNLDKRETGTFEIGLTSYASQDRIFAALPKYFLVQQGHKDGIVRIPEGAVTLASSLRWDTQVFRMGNDPIYAVQFHAELTKEDLIYRLHMYKEHYINQKKALDNLIKSLRSTPEASVVPKRFVEHCVQRYKEKNIEQAQIYSVM